MIKRKLAAVALLASLGAAGFAQANDNTFSDGRQGGAFWSQPIQAGKFSVNTARIEVGPTVVIESDGRLGGSFWGSDVALARAAEQFVGTALVQEERPYSFLEDYNP